MREAFSANSFARVSMWDAKGNRISLAISLGGLAMRKV